MGSTNQNVIPSFFDFISTIYTRTFGLFRRLEKKKHFCHSYPGDERKLTSTHNIACIFSHIDWKYITFKTKKKKKKKKKNCRLYIEFCPIHTNFRSPPTIKKHKIEKKKKNRNTTNRPLIVIILWEPPC